MAKILITGRQGCGKTSVIRELQRRGFTAYNTDDIKNVTKLQNVQTGEFVNWPETGVVDWTMYAWNWQKEELIKLLESDEHIFIGGVVSNQLDFYHLFDEVFVITVSENTLRKRLSSHEHRTHHEHGEIDRIARNHQKRQNLFIAEGAKPIDGEYTTEEIVDNLIKMLSLESEPSCFKMLI